MTKKYVVRSNEIVKVLTIDRQTKTFTQSNLFVSKELILEEKQLIISPMLYIQNPKQYAVLHNGLIKLTLKGYFIFESTTSTEHLIAMFDSQFKELL
jgi:hypothetical protein